MKTREIVWPAVVALAILSGKANASVSVIPLLEGEKWWGGAGGSGEFQPERVGTDPAQRTFYRVFRDFSPLNDLGSGYKTREAAVTGRRLFALYNLLQFCRNLLGDL